MGSIVLPLKQRSTNRRDGIFRENAVYLAVADTLLVYRKIASGSVGFTYSCFVKELAIRTLVFNKAKS
ncbi:Hypothetical protein FKW44_000332, partial [Caligus rogercresseyi]